MSSAKATLGFNLLQGQDASMLSPGNVLVLDERTIVVFLQENLVTNFDDDVDDPPEQDLALNVDHVFEADQLDAFDFDVDEAPTTHTLFMANLMSEDPIFNEAGTSYDSNIPFKRDLTPEQIFWAKDENDRKKVKASVLKQLSTSTVYPPNTPVKLVPTKSQVKINLYTLTQLFMEFDKTCKKRITPTGVTEGERGFEQTKRCYLTEVIPFFKTLKQHFEGVQKALFKEVKEMEEIFDQMSAEVDQNTVDKQCAKIERKNLLIANENLIANCLSNQLLFVVEQSRCLDLEAEISKLQNENQKDVNDEMIRGFNKLEVEYLNLQLKYQHLQENFGNNKSQTSQDVPEFDSFFKIKNLETQLQEKDNVIRNLKAQVSKMNDRSCETYNAKDVTALIEQNERVRAEIEKVKQHYKELYDSIKITRAHTSEKTSTMLNEIESLKAQLKSKVSCVTSDSVKPKVLAPGMYAIDVKPIPPPLKNNRSAHLNYINHLKESVETVREIVEEARVVKPLDNALNYACQYTKLSQELLEYVIGTCLKSFNKKVNSFTEASGSKPRSNTKNNRNLPAKSVNQKTVEDHPMTNKSVWTKVNRFDSSISSKRVVVQVILWYLDSGCLKHMTGNRSKLKNFVEKFTGIVRFRNDQFGAIMGYGDYVYGDSMISRVYYVEGLRHNLFSVGQFCDSDLEIAFRKHSCFVRDMNGVDLLKGSRSTTLYTISIDDMMKSSPVCFLSKASKIKSWLWHRRLNHLNFGTINDLARKDLVRGLPRLKFKKDHLCSACQLGKSKKYSHKPKTENTNMEVIHTLHMDLCGPMRVQSINGKKYILVIVYDYSRFTWVKFLRSKDETPEFVINFLKQIQVGVGIFHQKSFLRTPQQNGVVERRNRTLVEAARIMLIFSKALMFLWAAAVATACYTHNRSLMHTRHNKTPYELVHGNKPDLSFLRVFGALCYPTNDSEDLGLIPNQVHATNYVLLTDKDLELLFQPMFDEYFKVTRVDEPVPSATAVNAQVVLLGTSVSTTFTQDAPSTSYSSSSSGIQPPVIYHDVAVGPTIEDTLITQATLYPSVNLVTREPGSAQSSSGDVIIAETNQANQPPAHLKKWSKDHPLNNIVGNPSRLVSTRKQLASDALWCCYHTELSKVEPKNFKIVVIEDCWFQAMQDEIYEFDRLKV
ncbi:retrovirus-related pol polyprotein from transposon TNT 1-94 [Tanacetum coccineum]